MTDEPDPPLPGDEEPQRPHKRTHRRASRAATGGDPAANVLARAGRDETDAGWAPDAPESGTTNPAPRTPGPKESAEDQWWREQRPPHWE